MVPLNFFGSLQTIANFLGWGSIAANSATSAGLPISAWIVLGMWIGRIKTPASKWLKEKNKSITSQISSSCWPLAMLAVNFMISTRLEWSGWTKAWDKECATGAGWNNNAATDINVHVRHEQVWQHSKPSTCFFFRHPTHKTRVNQKKLHLPNGPISRKKMEANGWWR